MSVEVAARQHFDAAQEWAERNVPDEFAPFAAAAAMTLKLLGKPVTAEAVSERLRSQGRDAETMREKGWL